MTAVDIITSVVCPALGAVLATVMLLSPMPATIRIRRSGSMGNFNPLPYPLTLINCVGWVAYGLCLKDMWIAPPNIVGMCAGLFFSLQIMPYAQQRTQDMIMSLLVMATAYFCILAVVGIMVLTDDGRSQMWGIQSMVVLMCYYAVPLSTMVDVIKTRNAASIYMPLAVASMLNGSLWTAYGLFAVHNFNVWMPNLTGAVLAILQIVLRLVYGVKADSQLNTPEVSVSKRHNHVLDMADAGTKPNEAQDN